MAKPTIHDVARQAGVSIKTVSRVLNSEPNVSAEKQDSVRRAIELLKYKPSSAARRLGGKRSYLVALLYDNPSDSYVLNMQQGALRESQAEGYDLLIHPCDFNSENLVEQIETLVSHTSLDGLILTPPLSDHADLIDALDRSNVAYILVAPGVTVADDTAVYTSDDSSSADMTRYLASLGHEHIGFIIGHPDHGAVMNRFDGYKRGLKRAGLKFSKNLCAQGYNSFESGEECAHQLLQQKPRPSAIFASNDEMAAGTLKVAHEMGLRVPQDLSVAGFDDIPLATRIWPALTTIRQPMLPMAEKAIQLLLRKIRNEDDALGKCILESEIIIRDSTGPGPLHGNMRPHADPVEA